VAGLDVGVPGGSGGGVGMSANTHQVPSLGGSPARPTLLPGAAALLAAPPLGGGLQQQPLLPEQQHWLAVMGSLQHRTGVGVGRSDARPPAGPSLSGLPEGASAAAHRRLQQLAAGAGAAAAAAVATAGGGGGQSDSFGRYRPLPSLHSLQQLAPDLQASQLEAQPRRNSHAAAAVMAAPPGLPIRAHWRAAHERSAVYEPSPSALLPTQSLWLDAICRWRACLVCLA
jgi:hypothetical protein